MLTKGSFTRDEWNHLLRLLNIMNFATLPCNHFLSNRKQSTMSKRAVQSKTEEERVLAKSKPACLASRNLLGAKQTSSRDPCASFSPENQESGRISVFGSSGRPARDRSQNPTTHSQEWQEDDNPSRGTRKPARSGVCELSGSTGKPARGIENQLARSRLENPSLQLSATLYIEKVFKNLPQKLNDKMLDLKTDVLTWRFFMSTTMKALVHLGPNHNENVVGYRRNTNFEELQTLFDITQS